MTLPLLAALLVLPFAAGTDAPSLITWGPIAGAASAAAAVFVETGRRLGWWFQGEAKPPRQPELVAAEAAAPAAAGHELHALGARVDSVEAKVQQIGHRFTEFETRFDALDQRLADLAPRMTSVETRMGHIETRMTGLEDGLRDIRKEQMRQARVLEEHGVLLGHLDRRMTAMEGDLKTILKLLGAR